METEKSKRIEPGCAVRVCYPDGEQTNNPARKLDGAEFVVKSVKMPRNARQKRQFTLYGAESEVGLPYWFLEDELIKL